MPGGNQGQLKNSGQWGHKLFGKDRSDEGPGEMPNPPYVEHANRTPHLQLRSPRARSETQATLRPARAHFARPVSSLPRGSPLRFELHNHWGLASSRSTILAPSRSLRTLNSQLTRTAAGRALSPTIDRLANQNVNRNSAVLRLSARGILVRRWIRLGHSRWCQHSIGGPAAFLL